MLSEKGWPLSIQVHTKWSKRQSNEIKWAPSCGVSTGQMLSYSMMSWWILVIGGLVVECLDIFTYARHLWNSSEFPGIDVTKYCLMGWDSFSVWRKSCTLMWKGCLICFYSAWRCISTSPVSITAFSFQLSKFEKIRLPKSLLIFFAFKCGVLWNKALLRGNEGQDIKGLFFGRHWRGGLLDSRELAHATWKQDPHQR